MHINKLTDCESRQVVHSVARRQR